MLWSAGQFKTIEPHFTGTCNTISGVVGAEDITIHPITVTIEATGSDQTVGTTNLFRSIPEGPRQVVYRGRVVRAGRTGRRVLLATDALLFLPG